MKEWLGITPFVLAMGGVIVFLFLLVFYYIKQLLKQTQRLAAQLKDRSRELQRAYRQVSEVRSVAMGLGQKVSEQQEVILHLSERLKQLENTDNESRLYSRASKMVKLGADINELIEECELPPAEAELMLSLQKKILGKETIPPLTEHPDVNERKTRNKK